MLDIADSSPFEYGAEQDFVKSTMRKLANKSKLFNAALVLYNCRATVELNFTKSFDLDDFFDDIDNLPSLEMCSTSLSRIDLALQITSDIVFASQESIASKIAVLLTEGAQQFTLKDFPLTNASKSLKEKGIRLLVVGIGINVYHQQELLNITEETNDYIVVDGFSSLGEYEDSLVAKICSAAGKAAHNITT